mmetsp:Transcript_11707/g.22235  ORF Transcript_11707/g.22235 Transcript_11707/m.22235 type:complete len:237 (+) Transcript_11707:4156-4866(+)
MTVDAAIAPGVNTDTTTLPCTTAYSALHLAGLSKSFVPASTTLVVARSISMVSWSSVRLKKGHTFRKNLKLMISSRCFTIALISSSSLGCFTMKSSKYTWFNARSAVFSVAFAVLIACLDSTRVSGQRESPIMNRAVRLTRFSFFLSFFFFRPFSLGGFHVSSTKPPATMYRVSRSSPGAYSSSPALRCLVVNMVDMPCSASGLLAANIQICCSLSGEMTTRPEEASSPACCDIIW